MFWRWQQLEKCFYYYTRGYLVANGVFELTIIFELDEIGEQRGVDLRMGV